MKKLLVLNGGHSDIPLIQAGKKLGYYVITTGNQPNLIGHSYADRYIPADFSDYKRICEVADAEEIDAVCACANDFGAITAAYVAEKLGLPGHDSFETTLTLHHKDKFKKFAQEIKLQSPVATGFAAESEAVEYINNARYPIIVKPIDLTGGKGISRADTVEEGLSAVRNAFSRSPHKRIVIEPFIEGTYHSFNTFIVDRKVIFSFSDNEYSNADKYYVSTSAGPAEGIDSYKQLLIEETEKVARALNLVDGQLHSQYVLDKFGKPFIIEMTRRMCGDMYSVPVQRSTGVNTAEWIVRAECGLDCSAFPRNTVQKGFVGRHNLVVPHNGKIESFTIDNSLEKCIFDRFIWGEKGYKVSNCGTDKLGIIFYEFNSREEMNEIVGNITDLISYNYC